VYLGALRLKKKKKNPGDGIVAMASATPATTAAGTDAQPSCAEAARIAVVLYGEGATKVQGAAQPLSGG